MAAADGITRHHGDDRFGAAPDLDLEVRDVEPTDAALSEIVDATPLRPISDRRRSAVRRRITPRPGRPARRRDTAAATQLPSSPSIPGAWSHAGRPSANRWVTIPAAERRTGLTKAYVIQAF